MIAAGAAKLYAAREAVNELNVFPVPDGDTGTNMSMTMNAAAEAVTVSEAGRFCEAADKVSFATLRGARGNSGVILSQIFRGFAKSAKKKDVCTAMDLAQALSAGADAAYKAVMKPTEGTILTVAKAAAKSAYNAALLGENDATAILRAAVDGGNAALEKTPQMLPALKKAGVVDAGGKGFMLILEGALQFLETGKTPAAEVFTTEKQQIKTGAVQDNVQEIKFRYCTEFLIEKKDRKISADAFKSAIAPKGDCMLVIDDDDIVKVHIHTNHPGFVLEEAVKLGELVNLKIDNMKQQHRNIIAGSSEEKASEPEKEMGTAVVAAGKGFKSILKDLGADCVIEGGQTMNPSAEELLKAVEAVNAKTVFVFPNNKNIIMAAEQAGKLSDKNVIVIPTKNIPQCIAGLMEFSSERAAEDNEKKMIKAAAKVAVAQVTYAVRDTEADGRYIYKDDILGITGNGIEVIGADADDVCMELVDKMYDADESEYITVYWGKGIKRPQAEALAKRLERAYPDAETAVRKGGQPVYYYIAAVE